MMLKDAILLTLASVCQGWLWGGYEPEWNGLKVKWGINPFTAFNSMPRTMSEAIQDGWTNMDPSASCDGNLFRGYRYQKNGDLTVILIFDPAGYIAGIQSGFFRSDAEDYPTPQVLNKPVVQDGDYYYNTAYFVDPATLCDGRTTSEFETDGTGTGLWIQNGTNPVTNSVRMPDRQEDADNSLWTEGRCFWTMGKHYWYNLRPTMDCDEFFPVFLLYNGGVLNAFGWGFATNLEGPRYSYEHPPPTAFSSFMQEVPSCLDSMGTLSTLHIYLTNGARFSNRC